MPLKIILVNPPIREWSKPNVPPMGLLLLSDILRKAGHQVLIEDINATRADLSDVTAWTRTSPERTLDWMKSPAAECDMLGITGLITQWSYVKWFTAQYKKHHPNTVVVAGGPMVSNAPEYFTQDMTGVDAIVVGEGEISVLDVARDVEKRTLSTKREVRITTQPVDAKSRTGLEWNTFESRVPVYQTKDAGVPLDSIPFPDYENLATLDTYLHNAVGYTNQNRKWVDGSSEGEVRNLSIVSTRGCVFRCRFCQPRYMSTTARMRSVGVICDEMEMLIDKYDVKYIHFLDEITFFSKNRAIQFADEVIRRGLHKKIEWGCPTRIDTQDERSIKRCREAGMVWMGLGVESLSPTVLTAMDKYVHLEGGVERVIENIRHARSVLPVVDTSFIVGYPGETRETMQETIRNMHRVGEDFKPDACFYASPIPGTWLWDYAMKNGFIKDPVAYIADMGENAVMRMNFTDIPDDELSVWKRRVEQATLGEPEGRDLHVGPLKWANIEYSYPT